MLRIQLVTCTYVPCMLDVLSNVWFTPVGVDQVRCFKGERAIIILLERDL